MDIQKLHTAIADMGKALEDDGANPKGPPSPLGPRQPGQMSWDAGIFYFADPGVFQHHHSRILICNAFACQPWSRPARGRHRGRCFESTDQ